MNVCEGLGGEERRGGEERGVRKYGVGEKKKR